MVAKPPYCWVCHRTDFQNWDEVYNHMKDKSKVKSDIHAKNRSSQSWMKKYRHRNAINILNRPVKNKSTRQKLTEEQKQDKEDIKRELSGQTKYVKTKCPKCKTLGFDFVEVEHLKEPFIWIENERIIKNCEACKK